MTLDHALIFRAKRRQRENNLSPEERIAINVLRRRGVRISILSEVFKVARNTIYYSSLTGDADSYPNSGARNPARAINELVDRLGLDEAERQFVTPKIARAVNEANQRAVRRR